MEVKGTGIVPIQEYVRRMHAGRYEEWINSLPEEAKRIHTSPILYGDMYPYRPAVIEPTERACGLFFNGDLKGAHAMGRFAAEFALKGVLKIFIRVASPHFVMQRVAAIFGSYFSEGQMVVASRHAGGCVLQIREFPEPHVLQDIRIAGWIERGLELCGCRGIRVDMTKSMGKGDPVTEYVLDWA
jgi:hypothetical protein